MAKITLDNITSGFSSTTLFNTNFTSIEDELNDKVLYRDNPEGEANQMLNNIDMNSNDILNASTVNADIIVLGGTQITPSGTTSLPSDGISYDNTTSGLAATNVQDAIDEVDADLDTAEAGIVSNDVQLARGNNHGKNLLINGDFSVNKREVSGTVVLSSGIYGHDRFKAGASGCTYTFATSAGITTITISAGTLVQIVEGTSLPATSVVLSWSGTAQGNINSGSFGDSGLVTATTTGGSNTTVEFNIGTLSSIQLESGDTATEVEYVKPSVQLDNCLKYFERLVSPTGADEVTLGTGLGLTTTVIVAPFNYSIKRSKPTISLGGAYSVLDETSTIFTASTTATFQDVSTRAARLSVVRDSGTHAQGDVFMVRLTAATTNFIDIDAEL